VLIQNYRLLHGATNIALGVNDAVAGLDAVPPRLQSD
jgi:hypothetical protein